MDNWFEHFDTPLARLLLQFIVIIFATRVVGSLFSKVGQPAVLGEITAGILLGPSLFGLWWPEGSDFLFPKASLGTLQLISQIGVCVFMFVVGMELDPVHLRQKARVAVVISNVGIVVPFVLGIGAAFWLYQSFAAPGAKFTPFALFMGTAMSITAFPVLVRILKDRGLMKTPLGNLAIACAAVGDASAWAMLAVVVAVAEATSLTTTLFNLGFIVVFVLAMLLVVRPHLPRWLHVEPDAAPSREVMAAALIFMTASALLTEVMGIHALFGAFLAGVVMPQSKSFREGLTMQLENFSGVFLLPLFFAFSGLRTQFGLLNDLNNWLVCLGIIAIAMLGKLAGTMLAARFMGMKWNESFAIGALMNTRGLVELIALNIGYDLGILTPEIFTMMVLMALATTFMAGPLLHLAGGSKHAFSANAPIAAPEK
ncbi:MAG TPA: cation:proton antiporter [Verrucomicrobiae bacterium]|nr:cation:proton antiporter [Verrucomicrobiae bacterium]